MINDSGHQSAILLDFGKQLHGGLEIVAGRWRSGVPERYVSGLENQSARPCQK
jgi:hypothetical protein